jgi:hypothetical protein
MRLMSVTLTEDQVIARLKQQTRRLGWLPGKMINNGDQLCLVRKAMGRRRPDGTVEPLVRLAVVEVVSARRERLDAITPDDVIAEGFPDLSPEQFIDFFCRSMHCTPDTEVTVIGWRYDDEAFIRLLAGGVYRPEGVDLWYNSPNPAINGHTPRQLVERGEWCKPATILDQLASGAFA